jgi:hypothetical protein
LFAPKAIDLVFALLDKNVPKVLSAPPRSSVPALSMSGGLAAYVCVPSRVSVPAVTPMPPSCFENCGVQVCVRVKQGIRAVYVPPVASVSVSTAIPSTLALTAGVQVVPVKSSVLNHDPSVNVGTAEPEVRNKLGALISEPAVDPQVNVLVTDMAVVNPPVPVQVNPVMVAIDSTTVAAVVCARTIFAEPKIIERVFELLELNAPVVSVNPAKSNVPVVNVKVLVELRVNAPVRVVVPVPLAINPLIVLPFVVKVPLPTMSRDKLVYVPPVDNIRVLTFNEVPGSANAVVPKSNRLNQLPVVSVAMAVPDPVKVKFGALVVVPPAVLPTVNVLVISAAALNPPVPVQENPVIVGINRFVAAAVVVANVMLLAPNAMTLVFELFETKVPMVRSYPPRSRVPAVKKQTDVAVYVCVLSSVSVPPATLNPIPPSCLPN